MTPEQIAAVFDVPLELIAPSGEPQRSIKPGQQQEAAIEDRITDLIDRPCHGPDCKATLLENGPSEDFCSDSCQLQWLAGRSGVMLDAVGQPVIPDGLPEVSGVGLFQTSSMRGHTYMVPESLCAAASPPELDAVSVAAAGESWVRVVQETSDGFEIEVRHEGGYDADFLTTVVDRMAELPRATWDNAPEPRRFAYVQDGATLFEATVTKKKVSRWRREWQALRVYFRGE